MTAQRGRKLHRLGVGKLSAKGGSGLFLGRAMGASLFREQESEDEEHGHCQEGAGTQTAQVSADSLSSSVHPAARYWSST